MAGGFEIGSFQLDPEAGVLTLHGKPTALGRRAVALLAKLVEHESEYISKERLLEAGWPNAVVEEGNLPVQIAAIRRVLAANGGEQWIETLPRRGYRFVGPVKKLTKDEPTDGGARRSNLPTALTSFIGRERELVEVKRLLSAKRLLTIQGVGGIGKTRLALQAAAEVIDAYRDGIWLAELASIADPALVATTVAQSVGLAEKTGASLIEKLCAYLKTRQLLLVIDNCEHLSAACAALVEAVLRHTKEVMILATSREPLRISGEQSYVLQPLSLPEPGVGLQDDIRNSEAVQLFVERVQQQLPGFELTSERARAIAEICIHLDGIPLALELAAARTRSLSVEQVNARLADRFRLLTSGSRGALPRQQTLRATLDWSYDLLLEDERLVLRRLSIFPASFTVEAACAVASDGRADEYALVDIVAQLVSRSLLIADTSTAGTRYRLLETVRVYALEKLEETGETDACLQRHGRYFGDMFAREPEDSSRMSDPEWRLKYVPELANVRAALDLGLCAGREATAAIELAGNSGPLWTTLGLFSEGVQRLEAAMARVGPHTPEPAIARLWLWLGRLLDETPAKALPPLERAVALYRKLDDAEGLGLSLVRLGRVLALMGKFEQSEAILTEARPMLERGGSRALNHYHFNLGFLKNRIGDQASARSHYERALELARAEKNELSILATLGNLANVKWGLGDLDAAEESYRELLPLLRNSPACTRRLLGFGLMNFAHLLLEQNDLDRSLVLAREGLPLVKGDGSAWIFSDYGSERAVRQNKIDKAALLAGYADHMHNANGGIRDFITLRTRNRIRGLLSEKLSADELGRLRVEGSKLSEEDAWRMALED